MLSTFLYLITLYNDKNLLYVQPYVLVSPIQQPVAFHLWKGNSLFCKVAAYTDIIATEKPSPSHFFLSIRSTYIYVICRGGGGGGGLCWPGGPYREKTVPEGLSAHDQGYRLGPVFLTYDFARKF